MATRLLTTAVLLTFAGTASAQLRTSMPAAPRPAPVVRVASPTVVPTYSPGISTAFYSAPVVTYNPFNTPFVYTDPFTGITSASAQSYNPYTGTYTQVGQSYNPYTGVTSLNRQSFNPYTGNAISGTQLSSPFGGVFNRVSGGNVFTGQSFSNTSRFNIGYGSFIR